MKVRTPAIRVTLAGVLAACLLAPAPAPGARNRAITGTLDGRGLTVVALAPGGDVSKSPAKPRFRIIPPARTVTLHLRDRNGTYLGPVVVAGGDDTVILGVRPGAKLGRITVRNDYARAVRPARGS